MHKSIAALLLLSICVCSQAQIKRHDIKRSQLIVTPGLVRSVAAIPTTETTTVRKDFPAQIIYRLFRKSKLARQDVKGIILLSNYDRSLSTPLLVNIAHSLANQNYISAIIQYRQDARALFNAQADTLGKDYENVWNEISSKYGGTAANTVIGGLSFSGFAVSYLTNQPQQTWLRDIKGIALIAASASPYSRVPVINMVCTNDPDVTDTYGNRGGGELQNEMNAKNPAIAALSGCETDPGCTGHNGSDNWAGFFISKIKNWLP